MKKENLNGFHMEEIAAILADNNTDKLYGVIYSLGRDAENEVEFHYAYDILLRLCDHADSRIRAYSLVGLSLLAGEGELDREKLTAIFHREWSAAGDDWTRGTLETAAKDLRFKLGWTGLLANGPVRRVYLRILTTDDSAETEDHITSRVRELLKGETPVFSGFGPYWKCDGWGELNCTLDTARDLSEIQNIFADHWESDTASSGIRLPGVGFLWIGE